MLSAPTAEKLRAMKLYAMADSWEQQEASNEYSKVNFDERFGLLVDAEFLARENRRLGRLLREAKLRISHACVEDVDTSGGRGIDRTQLRKLGSCVWVHEHRNVMVTGATGVGKTYLACALGQQACRKGHRVLYRRLPRLLDELTLSHADGSYHRLLARLARMDVLILDDWGLPKMNDAHRHDVLEILEDRYDRGSTVMTSQLPVAKWHDYISDPSVADALLDRVVHNAYKIELKGPSRRKENAQKKP